MRAVPVILALLLLCSPSPAEELPPFALQQRGDQHLFAGRFKEAIADYDLYLNQLPARAPHHWQRGIALYYAGEYDKGTTQFVSHQTVNRHDVENAVWHFLCVVRGTDGSVAKARETFIPIVGDTRVPLKEVHDLFAGKGTPKAVLKAAQAKAKGERLRNQLCYAHLYLGLYWEALGDAEQSAAHMKLAATTYKMDHYMGKIAQLHHRVRK